MANAALSNRERRQLRKVTPKPPRVERGEAVVRVAAAPKKDEEMDGRDGLMWLKQKNRLKADQLKAALWCSDRLRDAGEVALRSCLEAGVGGGRPDQSSPSPLVSMTTAKRELFVLRFQVLRGQKDMILVIEGVCGARHTLRYLAGGDKHKARDLEMALRLALDLVAAWLKEPDGA